MSPRKSSTSSGRPARRRPRYLGIEVAGELLPAVSPAWWERTLTRLLDDHAPVPVRFRVIRADGPRAVVEVDHRDSAAARSAWNAVLPDGGGGRLRTYRTWGTLLGAKAWMRGRTGPRDEVHSERSPRVAAPVRPARSRTSRS